MLSAYSQKVTELEAKLGEHDKCLNDLKKILEKRENDKEDPVKNIPKDIQRILLSFQGELKDQSFVVNTVQSKVHSFKEELNSFRQYIYEHLAKQTELDIYMNVLYDLRSDVDKISECIKQVQAAPPNSSQQSQPDENAPEIGSGESGANAETTTDAVINSTLNPDVEEFVPRFALPGNISPLFQNTEQGTPEFPHLNLGNCDKTETESKNLEGAKTEVYPKYGTASDEDGNKDPEQFKCDQSDYTEWMEYNDMEKYDFMSPCERSPECYHDQGTDAEKHRIIVLEIELAEKIQALAKANEKMARLCMSQEESMKKIDWLEHKVRLLKQDKKRRGETIGKLLRCVDDLRNCGKLDFNRATCERAILTSTLSTRGMPHEERIQVAINVTEAEQLHQYCPDDNSPRFGSDGVGVYKPGDVTRPGEGSKDSSLDDPMYNGYNVENSMASLSFVQDDGI